MMVTVKELTHMNFRIVRRSKHMRATEADAVKQLLQVPRQLCFLPKDLCDLLHPPVQITIAFFQRFEYFLP